jgi:hypothetical protein
MNTKSGEARLAQILAFGGFFTSIFVVTSGVTDPVNVTKFVSLGVTGGATFGLLLFLKMNSALSFNHPLILISTVFLSFALVSVSQSESPLVQNLYGDYGRNNGYFTYLFLTVLMIGASSLRDSRSYSRIVNGLVFAGIVNMIYCMWVIVFGDFLGWSNPYGNILGTFGNPNFIGSFLGIFFSVVLAYGLNGSSPKWLRVCLLPILGLIGFVIVESSAIQGRVVAALGTGLVLFFYLRSRFSFLIQALYSILAIILGFLGIAGALQRGPFVEYIYKNSVSLRGQYWLAGWNTGQTNPFFGSGMDAFGDWYRRSRDIRAIELPGVDTVVNTAHNVPLDMFAFGGWPLFLSYLGIVSLGVLSILKLLLRGKKYDVVAVSLIVAWIGYQVQSIISINQIGLAIWGWILTGSLIGYELCTREGGYVQSDPKTTSKAPKLKSQGESGQVTLLVSAFSLVGLLLALPPLAADSKWRSAQSSATVAAIEESMKPSLFNPQNSMKYVMNIQILEQSSFKDLARKYALEATTWNPDSYDLWRLLYFIENSSQQERSLALKNMKRLDPLNPDVTAPR